MSPLSHYQASLAAQQIEADASQKQAIEALAQLHKEIVNFSFIKKILKRNKIKGIYLWGSVGRGKTYLMDLFYQSVSISQKKRIHFHAFMQEIQKKLSEIKKINDPIPSVVKCLFKHTKVLCLDEFCVDEIAEAMILKRLLYALFKNHTVIVATSNLPIDQLYKDGLQRERFLSAIDFLKKNMREINLNSKKDYRLNQAHAIEIKPSPKPAPQAIFEQLTKKKPKPVKISCNHQFFYTQGTGSGVMWCTFSEWCEKPRNNADYLAVVKEYHTILISDIPILNDMRLNASLRFIHFIDILYDEQIRLIAFFPCSLSHLYQGKTLAFKFQRTESRLHEMLYSPTYLKENSLKNHASLNKRSLKN